MTTGPTSHRFVSQRLRLHYADWGNRHAPLLILQHGGRDHARSWDQMAQALRKDWHVVCPDLRGHGDSDWSPEGNYRMDAMVYDLAQLVHTLLPDESAKVAIVGHSLGGSVATHFTGLYPEKVARFVNIEGLGPPLPVRREQELPVGDRLRRWIGEKRRASSLRHRSYASLDEALQRMKKQHPGFSDALARHLTTHAARRNEDGSWSWKFDPYCKVWDPSDLPAQEIADLWRAIACPVLLLWGKGSWASSPRADGRMEHLPTAELIEYENAGHWPHHDQFERLSADVMAFLG